MLIACIATEAKRSLELRCHYAPLFCSALVISAYQGSIPISVQHLHNKVSISMFAWNLAQTSNADKSEMAQN